MRNNLTSAERIELFCGLMNKKAAELGMVNTLFKDPAGFRNTSSAMDIMHCFLKSLEYDMTLKILGQTSYTAKTKNENPREITFESKTHTGNGIEALHNHYKVLGGKGGTLTYHKQYNSTVVVEDPDQNGLLVSVVMGADEARNMPNNIFMADKQALDNARGIGNGTVCAKSAVVCKVGDSATPLFQKDPNLVAMPASMSKIMTLVLVLEHVKDFEAEVKVTQEVIDLMEKGFYQKDIKDGDILTVFDLMNAMMLPSSNAAAFMLAHYVGGIIG